MSYAHTITVSLPYEEAVIRTREALSGQGFGVLSEIDVRATCEAKLGSDAGQSLGDYLILGVCNPALAQKALAADPDMGLLLPCNVVIRRGPDDSTTVILAVLTAFTFVFPRCSRPCANEPSLGDELRVGHVDRPRGGADRGMADGGLRSETRSREGAGPDSLAAQAGIGKNGRKNRRGRQRSHGSPSQLRNFATSQLRNFADSPSMRCVNPAGISSSPSPLAFSAWSLTHASSRFCNPPQTDRKRDHAQGPVTDSPFRGRRVREHDGQSPRSRLGQHCPRRRAARTVATGMLTAPDPRRRKRTSLAALA
jgi:uncharacterized protein (DUF302 family)